MKTSIYKVSDGSIQVQQSTSYPKNGRKGWDRQVVYLDKKMVAKIVKEFEQK